MAKKDSVRLKDVAKEAGVSPSTVSYALRDYDRLSADTIKKVKAAAKKLGYKPSPVLGALAEYRWRKTKTESFNTLVIVHAYSQGQWPGRPNRKKVFEAIESHADQLGYGVEVFDVGQTKERQQLASRILYNRGIKGVFVAPHLYDEKISVPVSLDWKHFCAISLLNEQPTQKFHAVLPSWVKNRQLILSKLEGLLDLRIGTYVTEAHSAWLGGLSSTISPQQNWVGTLPDNFVPTQVVEDYNKELFLKWFNEYMPKIIITNIEWIPVWLEELGLNVPQEHGVIFIDQVQESWRTGINVLPRHIGITATNLMDDLLRGYKLGLPEHPYRLTVPGEWHEGTTFDPQYFTAKTST